MMKPDSLACGCAAGEAATGAGGGSVACCCRTGSPALSTTGCDSTAGGALGCGSGCSPLCAMVSVISAGSTIAVCTAFDLLKLRFGLMTIRSPARPRVIRLAAVVSDVTSGSDAVLKAGETPPDCTL